MTNYQEEICIGLLLSSSAFLLKKENELFFRLRVQHPNKKYLELIKKELFKEDFRIVKDRLTQTFFLKVVLIQILIF
jgi:hypothetical protein